MSRRKPNARKPQRSPSGSGSDRRDGPKNRPAAPGRKPAKAGPKAGPRPNRPDRQERPDRPDRATRPPRQDRPDRTDRPAHGERPQRPGRPDARAPRQDRPDTRPPRAPRPESRPESRHDSHGDGRPRQHHRPQHGRGDLPVWLYGSHACLAALQNEARYHRRLLLTIEARDALGHDLDDALPHSLQPEMVDRLRLDSLLPPGAVHQGIALLTDPLEDPGVESLKDPLGDGREMVVVLDHVTDPRNVGAILRSAAAFGARAVIVTDRNAPEATGALAKAASGGLEVVPLLRVTNLARALDLLAEYGFWRVGLEMEAEKTLAEAVHDIRRVALVLGAEDEGLRRLTREKCDFLAKLPMTGMVESLNVSAAAAVALYECVRDFPAGREAL